MQHSKADKRGGNRSTTGKRKLGNGNIANCDESTQGPRTIPDLFAHEKSLASSKRTNGALPPSPSGKRARLGSSPNISSKSEPIPVDKMYNFSSTDSSKGANKPNTVRLGQSTQPGANNSKPYNAPNTSNYTPHSGAKKLVVKNLRALPRLDQDQYFEKVWGQLDDALTAIFNDGKPKHSLEELYKGAENVCRQGRAAKLAKKLQDRCEGHISGKVLETLRAKSAETEEVDCLRAVEAAWATWNSRLVTIRSVFYYLDQSFLLHSPDNPVIYKMGLQQFRSAVFSDRKLKSKILRGACLLVEQERKDEPLADATLLKRTIKLFNDLGVYSSDFEPELFEASSTYLQAWADEKSQAHIATYVDKCHKLIDREMERCDLLGFDRNTKRGLSGMLDKALVLDKEDVLCHKQDIVNLLRSDEPVPLEQLYSLLQRQDMGVKLKGAFAAYIVEAGSAIVFDEKREGEMVIRLLEFKQQLDKIWIDSFHKHEVLGNCLRESFETFINQGRKTEATWNTDNPKPGEMIAKYVDLLLKGGLKAIQGRGAQSAGENRELVDEDTEISKQLDQVLDLFRFVHGKAVFEAFYKNDLARRLLMGRSASDDAEKGMLARLKSECGAGFTHNLESMFKDIDLARDEMAAYNTLVREKEGKPALDLNVHVLSSAAWPSYPDVPVNMPTAISRALSDFGNFYNSKYKGRKLHWKHSLAHCQLKAHFPKGYKELVVSSFQAIVLLLFNDLPSETLSYPELKDATGLSDVELKRTLQSLACARYRVLKKEPKGKEVNEKDIFTFNTKFEDPKMRIKINQIQLKETKQENKTTHERVAADRHFETQAAIVRIMKSRKEISHPELISEVIKATRSRGVLELADIKHNIERLIEKDYMEREEGNKYRYLA